MFEFKEDFFQKRGDQLIQIDDDVKRHPLVMIPKDNDFDPEFPVAFYRMGKYVTVDEAKKQEYLEYMSKSLYDICVREHREDTVQCYKEKCAIFATIIKTLRYGPSKGIKPTLKE